MKNNLGRLVPSGFKPYLEANDYLNHQRKLIPKKKTTDKIVFSDDLEAVFLDLDIKPGMTISFHHHLRSGDNVLNIIASLIRKHKIKGIHIAPSSIFPEYEIKDLLLDQSIIDIHTNYLNGPVADIIGSGLMEGKLFMHTHGGRARAIESGDLPIDIAFLACPAVDRQGNGSGAYGTNACGTLGYAISDLMYAKKVVLVTDTIVDKLPKWQFDHTYVDYVVKVPSIGDARGIVSGTTRITRDPIGLKIARDTADLVYQLGIVKDGLSMQTGAGGTSLAVADAIKKIMIENKIKGSFASGGITSYFVEMLKEGLFKKLYDVQCFDLEAVGSYRDNSKHIAISASEYGNPYDPKAIVNDLDLVILGAAEVDLDFNVNVTTDSFGKIIGGSGGHADTANGAKLTIITSTLAKTRIPLIKERVRTITTPGEDVDILVTERGIAVNPKRKDIIEILQKTKIPLFSIRELMDIQYRISGIPKDIPSGDVPVGYVIYRDGTVIDTIFKLR
ncbi:MAG: citrate lyase subunit alpha [Candidatus Izemoplasmatales bacterium]|jgi:citrate lyase subunit alpha/citrate CoA-transferase